MTDQVRRLKGSKNMNGNNGELEACEIAAKSSLTPRCTRVNLNQHFICIDVFWINICHFYILIIIIIVVTAVQVILGPKLALAGTKLRLRYSFVL